MNNFVNTKILNATTSTNEENIVWDLSNNPIYHITLKGDETLDNPINRPVDQICWPKYLLFVKQDAVGGRTLNFGSDYKFPEGITPTLSAKANAIDVISFVSDGTSLYGVISKDLKQKLC